jgi:hypothetical protein
MKRLLREAEEIEVIGGNLRRLLAASLPLVVLIDATTRVALGLLTAARRNYLGVRCVPISASQAVNVSVSYVENRRPDSVHKRPSCARKLRPQHNYEKQPCAALLFAKRRET